jgi:hypothetical protein
MNVFSFAQSLPQALNSLSLDDSSISVLAMLVGIVGGATLASLRQRLKSQKVKVARKPPSLRGKHE